MRIVEDEEVDPRVIWLATRGMVIVLIISLVLVVMFATTHKVHADGGEIYTVRAGETFGVIAQNLGVSQAELRAANPQVRDINYLWAGQMLDVPTPRPLWLPTIVDRCRYGSHLVQQGESFYFLTTKLHTTTVGLLKANGWNKPPRQLYPGQRVCVPAGGY